MLDNENFDNTNEYSMNYYQSGNDENSISKYQVDRRLKQSQLKRQVRKSKHKINLVLFFLRIFLLVFLVFVISHLFRLKYWRLNPKAFSSLGNSSIKIENNSLILNPKNLNTYDTKRVL